MFISLREQGFKAALASLTPERVSVLLAPYLKTPAPAIAQGYSIVFSAGEKSARRLVADKIHWFDDRYSLTLVYATDGLMLPIAILSFHVEAALTLLRARRHFTLHITQIQGVRFNSRGSKKTEVRARRKALSGLHWERCLIALAIELARGDSRTFDHVTILPAIRNEYFGPDERRLWNERLVRHYDQAATDSGFIYDSRCRLFVRSIEPLAA